MYWIRNINSKALHAYSFDGYSLHFTDLYLKGRKQKTKINSSYNLFAKIFVSVTRGSILGPLLFNIYVCGCWRYSVSEKRECFYFLWLLFCLRLRLENRDVDVETMLITISCRFAHQALILSIQKQPSGGVLTKKCSKIWSKFIGEHPCQSVISIKLLCNVNCNHTSAWVISYKLASYF